MAWNEILQAYRNIAAYLQTTQEHHIFTLPSLQSIAEEGEETAKSVMTLSTFIVAIFTVLGISISIC